MEETEEAVETEETEETKEAEEEDTKEIEESFSTDSAELLRLNALCDREHSLSEPGEEERGVPSSPAAFSAASEGRAGFLPSAPRFSARRAPVGRLCFEDFAGFSLARNFPESPAAGASRPSPGPPGSEESRERSDSSDSVGGLELPSKEAAGNFRR